MTKTMIVSFLFSPIRPRLSLFHGDTPHSSHTMCELYEFNGQGLGPLLDSQGEWSVDFRRASADAGPL